MAEPDGPYESLQYIRELLEGERYREALEALPKETWLVIEGLALAVPLLVARIEQLELLVSSQIASVGEVPRAGPEGTEPNRAGAVNLWGRNLAAFLVSKLAGHVDHPLVEPTAKLLPAPPAWDHAAADSEPGSGASSGSSGSGSSSGSGQ